MGRAARRTEVDGRVLRVLRVYCGKGRKGLRSHTPAWRPAVIRHPSRMRIDLTDDAQQTARKKKKARTDAGLLKLWLLDLGSNQGPTD
jgi:hypothetical protein